MLMVIEEALLRFERLGGKCYDVAELQPIQDFLSRPDGCGDSLLGCDAHTWGSMHNPQDFASDLIQVVERPRVTAIGKLLRRLVLRWAPDLPSWLFLLIFWSKKRPDILHQYSFSSRAFDVMTSLMGNIVTSLLVYAAVTFLYLTDSEAASVAGVLVVAGIITICSVLFRNQQFTSMLATCV